MISSSFNYQSDVLKNGRRLQTSEFEKGSNNFMPTKIWSSATFCTGKITLKIFATPYFQFQDCVCKTG